MIVNLIDAYNELYTEMFPKLKRIANIKIQNEQTAEDLAQDTLLVTYDNFERVIQFPSPKSWVYKVLQNKIKQELRAKARFAVFMSKLENQPQEAQPSDDGWKDLLHGLSPKSYEVLHMIYVEGYDNREAAERLNIPYDACRKRVQRAKEEIRSKNL